MNNKVVLAFSGGLDTSFCVKYLKKELNLDVYSVLVNTGGFDEEQIGQLEEKARMLGVCGHTSIDETSTFYQKAIKYLVFGNILRNNTYPLSVSAERTFQAIAVANYANELRADYVAHGSTGAGNDQVRFDLIFQILCPTIKIITPIRDNKFSRKQEIAYLQKEGIDLPWEKAKYSINKGLWGTSVGGAETLTSDLPLPENAFPSQLKSLDKMEFKLSFKQGELIGLNGSDMSPVDCIRSLNKTAGDFAIGRDTHIGDTIIGTKGRVGFEAPAPMIIIKAHHVLEKHTLTKWQQYWKDQLANWYGMMMHEGQYLEPLMRNIETFLEDTQKNVSGVVKVSLAPYHFSIVGISSDHDLMNNDFGLYGEMNNDWTGEDVRGFTKIMANQIRIFNSVNKKTWSKQQS